MADNEISAKLQRKRSRNGLAEPRDSLTALSRDIAEKIDLDQIVTSISSKLQDAIRDTVPDAIAEAVSAAGPHRTWLASIDRIAQNSKDIDDLRDAISSYLRQAGIRRIDTFAGNKERFVITSENTAEEFIVTQPAYIDMSSNRTILAGRARGIKRQSPVPAVEHSEDLQ